MRRPTTSMPAVRGSRADLHVLVAVLEPLFDVEGVGTDLIV